MKRDGEAGGDGTRDGPGLVIEHLLEVGELRPDDIHLPGVFVDHIVLASDTAPQQPMITR